MTSYSASDLSFKTLKALNSTNRASVSKKHQQSLELNAAGSFCCKEDLKLQAKLLFYTNYSVLGIICSVLCRKNYCIFWHLRFVNHYFSSHLNFLYVFCLTHFGRLMGFVKSTVQFSCTFFWQFVLTFANSRYPVSVLYIFVKDL